MANIQTCNHTKDDGSPCNAFPVGGTPYCYFHRKFYNPPALPGDAKYQAPLLESHASIQIALTHLYQAFLAKKIDMKEANFGLQILRLASKTIAAIEKAKKEEEKKQTDVRRPQADGRRSPSTGHSDAPKVTVWERATSPIQADRSSASSGLVEPKRGVWDPYGCMPSNGNK